MIRGGSFNPCSVAAALDGFEFNGLGNGPTFYRAADHLCFKDVLVVQGNENPTDAFDILDLVEITPGAQVEYEPDHPMFAGGSLRDRHPGA